jgi:poly(hydroxyalkanoate) granule-associated protein
VAEVKVMVNDTSEEEEVSTLVEVSRTTLLAGIGAAALTEEALSDLFTRLVERGERVELRRKSLFRDKVARRRAQIRKVVKRGKEDAKEVEDKFEAELQGTLERMNVPTQNDIEALTAKVVALTEKIDELKVASQ